MVQKEMWFKEKNYRWTDDGQTQIKIAHLEPSGSGELKQSYNPSISPHSAAILLYHD